MHLYVVTEKYTWLLNLSRMVFSITFTFLEWLCLKWTSPFQGKHISLGGMNHCWLNHLLLRAEARSSGSSCDVWVSCSGSIPLWLFNSWLNLLSKEMAPPYVYLTGGLSEVMHFCKGESGMGWWRKGKKHQSSFKATHLVFTSSPGSVLTSEI